MVDIEDWALGWQKRSRVKSAIVNVDLNTVFIFCQPKA